MAQQLYLSCYVRYFNGHLLFIHQDISFIRHFFRGRILAEVSSGQKTHHNCCNLKHTMKKNCNTTSDALPTLSKKHACFMVPDNDFDIKKCPILISLRLVDHVLYTSNIRFISLANVTKEVEQCMSLCKIHHESNGMRYS